jgi:RND family efflux transporter MFP subunit
VVPGTVEPLQDTAIYARVSGYVKHWSTDIGRKVKSGETLAELETPELDAQLMQAQADLRTADANHTLAKATAARWRELLKTEAVAKQDAEQKFGDEDAKRAAVESARANVDRLQKTQAFKRIVSPFDGVVTARSIDVGRLVNAGASGADAALFHVADASRLRVYFNVPEANASEVRVGQKAKVALSAYAAHTFEGDVVRTADTLDPASRTLRVEVELDNRNANLLPGGYAEVTISLPTSTGTVIVPATALLFRSEGMRVATIGSDQRVKLVKVTPGRDFGREVEVLAGLAPDARIVVNPSDSLVDGIEVKPVSPPSEPGK